MMRLLVCLLSLALLLVGAPGVAAQDPVAQEVGTTPRDSVELETLAYPAFAADGSGLGNLSWRIIDGLGNCCEAQIAATSTGRLVEFGGTFLVFSDDRGETWHQVDTPIPYLTGEGIVSAAPGGDIVAVGWSPYSGDQLWSHKYEADNDKWYYAPIPVHTPFYDRPWIAVVPGGAQTATGSGGYSVVLDGYPSHKSTFVSIDGLHYDKPTNQHRPLPGDAGAFEIAPDPVLDWIKPHVRAEVLALGEGRALGSAYLTGCGAGTQAVMDPDLVWRCRTTGIPATDTTVDSRGWVHHFEMEEGAGTLVYRLTRDGGQSWNETKVTLPGDMVLFEDDAYDVAAHGGMGLTALAVHALDTANDTHQDMVLRFDTRTGTPIHMETGMVGEGGFRFGASVASEAPRFDFISVAIMPDGRLAVSFKDASHKGTAAVAVEAVPMTMPARAETAGDGTAPGPANGSDPADDGSPAARVVPPMARFTLDLDGPTVRVDATASWDPDGEVVAYTWDWDDGSTSDGVRAQHTYTEAGLHHVTLQVTDDDGRTATVERTFRIDAASLAAAGVEDDRALPAPGAAVVLLLVSLVLWQTARRRS